MEWKYHLVEKGFPSQLGLHSTLQKAILVRVRVWGSIHMPMWWFLSTPHIQMQAPRHTLICTFTPFSCPEDWSHLWFKKKKNYIFYDAAAIWSLIPQWSVGPQSGWGVTSSFELPPVQLQAPAFLFLSHSLYCLILSVSLSVALVSITLCLCLFPLSFAVSYFLSPSPSHFSAYPPSHSLCVALLLFLSLFQEALKESQASELMSQNCPIQLLTGYLP